MSDVSGQDSAVPAPGWWQDRRGAWHAPGQPLVEGPSASDRRASAGAGHRDLGVGLDDAPRSHPLLNKDFFGARLAARVFLTVSAILLILGAFAAPVAYRRMSNQGDGGHAEVLVIVSIVAGAILAASVFAFFGYVLQLLMAANVRNDRLSSDLGDLKDMRLVEWEVRDEQG